MRHLLNRLFRPLGYHIEKISHFDAAFERMLRDGTAPKFVQIGANDGIQFDNLYHKVTAHRLPGLAVEPLPDFHAALMMNYRYYPQVKIIRKAVHPTAKELSLWRVTPEALPKYPPWVAGIASFDKNHLLAKTFLALEDIVEEIVPCVHLMDLVAEFEMLNADLLQVDTEGFDGEVLRMIDFSQWKPRLIKYEHINLASLDKASVERLLRAQGYYLFEEKSDTVAVLAR